MTRHGLWWVPLVLLAAPFAGMAPVPRDMVDYFLPMRGLSAEQALWHDPAWINLANGCGETWFANPQTGMLYPPHWLYSVLPAPWAVTLEVALHLALLSLGVGLLAARWGADRWGRAVAETAAFACGPVVVSIGVVNNLETAAWLPWVVLAAQGRTLRAVVWTALATALAWLGGEPQVWALGMVLVTATATSRWRALAGIGLGAGVVSVQMVAFVYWVVEGDRGAASAAATLEGALTPVSWCGLLVPGLAEAAGGDYVYVSSLFLGAPILACALIAASGRPRRLVPTLVLGVLATLPAIGGGEAYAALTRGMVRFPARFAMVGIACLLPLVGLGVVRWRRGEGDTVAAVVGGLTLVLCAAAARSWSQWLIAALPAAVMVIAAARPRVRWLRDGALATGAIACVAAGIPLLGVHTMNGRGSSPWPEIGAGERVYTVPVAGSMRQWMATGMAPRRLLEVGYLNLDQGVSVARTYAPVAHRRLTEHLGQADQGPGHRWWLDSLGAQWAIMAVAGTPEAMVRTRRRGGLSLFRNLRALPVLSMASHPPSPDRTWQGVGAVVAIRSATSRVAAEIASPKEGWAWLSLAPVTGWAWRLDGDLVEAVQGPGIVQSIRVPAGRHRLEGVYRPPALAASLSVSLLALCGVCYLWWSGRRGREPAPARGGLR